MKQLSHQVISSLAVAMLTVTVSPAFAAQSASDQDAKPMCGDEKKGGEKDEKKGDDTKPKAPSLR